MSFLSCSTLKQKKTFYLNILKSYFITSSPAWNWKRVPETAWQFWFVGLSISGWTLGLNFFLGLFSMEPRMTWAHAEPFRGAFMFYLHQQGMEWSLLGLPPSRPSADLLEVICCPEMRRHRADLLFRGYSLPVDKKKRKQQKKKPTLLNSCDGKTKT